ncbi:hypothetical protein EYR38_009794 [Pleurotus pulmonarius]|nr:hypothetical protein EYR38_009794 [Pleurotus pulmonarius]
MSSNDNIVDIDSPAFKNDAQAAARKAKGGGDEEASLKKRKLNDDLKQGKLRVFKGISVPFSEAQRADVQKQFLRATISANLPFTWVSNAEVQKLLVMFRSTAEEVIPSRDVLSGRLLKEESAEIEKRLKLVLAGKYAVLATDGWKDISRNAIAGINVSVEFEAYLVKLKITTQDPKDRAAMCLAFGNMIDEVEEEYKCSIVCFCTDNDGGSQAGQKLLIKERPWIFGPPCCAHQFQLILGDYFKVNTAGADIGVEATEVQAEMNNGTVLTYLVANLTRWTTHFVAFSRLVSLQEPLRRAAYFNRREVVAAQVGAEKGAKGRKLEEAAIQQCDRLDSGDFWAQLSIIVNDIEPICYGTNINQSDKTRPDQVLLTFAGIWLHFKEHKDAHISAGMCTHIEKRWKALDQVFFIVALVLNPYEGTERFGPQAGLTALTLNTMVIKVSPKQKEVSVAFLNYLGGTGAFVEWEENRQIFESVHIGANLRREHQSSGDQVQRKKRENHVSSVVDTLLWVPRHDLDADATIDEEDGAESDANTPLVKTTSSWRKELVRQEMDERELNEEVPGVSRQGTSHSRSLMMLFGGGAKPLGQPPRRRTLDDESRLMELIAAEYEGEAPDDGALEGSGDEYEP